MLGQLKRGLNVLFTLRRFHPSEGNCKCKRLFRRFANLNVQYRLQDGTTSTLQDDFNTYLDSIMDSPSTSATTAVIYGSISESDYNTLTSTYTNIYSPYGCENNFAANDLTSSSNDSWYYANFEFEDNDSLTGNYTGYSFYYTV